MLFIQIQYREFKKMKTVIPTLAVEDSTLVLQPIAQGYIPTARAVATALLYRYMGINTGFGVESQTSTAATRAQPTPLHLLQVVFAEWLLVYAGLEADGHDLSMVGVSGLKEPFIGTTSPSDVPKSASGSHIPSFASLLAFLADWIGSIVPSYTSITCGDLDAETTPFLKTIASIRVASQSSDKPIHDVFKRGVELSPEDFIDHLNTMLVRAEAKHGTRILIGECSSETKKVYLRKVYGKSTSILPPIDLSIVCSATQTVSVPVSITLNEDEVVDAISGVNVVIGKSENGAWNPVLPTFLADAALQRVAIEATAETLVAAITTASPGFAELREILSKAYILNFATNTEVVKTSVSAAFAARFPDSPAIKKTKTSPTPTHPLLRALPFRVHSARQTHKLAGPLLSLYYIPETFRKLQDDIAAVLSFFETFDLVKTPSKTLFISRPSTCLGTLEAHPYEDYFEVSPSNDAIPDALPLESALGKPMWSVILMREDLLAIALSSSSKPRKALAKLWELHTRDVVGSRFDDDVSESIVTEVVEKGADALRGAAEWVYGPLMELVFSFEHQDAALGLLQQLQNSTDVFVAEKDGKTFVGYRGVRRGLVTVSKVMHGDKELFLKDLSEEQVLRVADLDACSEPPLHGLILSTTQAALFAGAANSDLRAALERLVRHTKSEVVNSQDLIETMEQDIEDLQDYLA